MLEALTQWTSGHKAQNWTGTTKSREDVFIAFVLFIKFANFSVHNKNKQDSPYFEKSFTTNISINLLIIQLNAV